MGDDLLGVGNWMNGADGLNANSQRSGVGEW